MLAKHLVGQDDWWSWAHIKECALIRYKPDVLGLTVAQASLKCDRLKPD